MTPIPRTVALRPGWTLIRPGLDDYSLWAAHLTRQAAQSGRDGVPLFEPYNQPRDGDDPARRERFHRRRTRLPGAETDWQVAWAVRNEAGDFIAHCHLTGPEHETALHRAKIGLGVEQRYHCCGLGEMLMTQAIEFAQGIGLAWIDLVVLAENTAAVALYRKLRFVEVGHVQDQFRLRGQQVANVLMTLRLV